MSVADLRLEVAPGQGLVARWGGTVLVLLEELDAPGCEEVVAIVRTAVATGDDGRALAYRLGAFIGAAGPEGVPAFGVVADARDGEGRAVVLLHGAAMMHATGPGLDETLVGADRPTWVDEYLPAGADRIAIGPAGAAVTGAAEHFDLVAGAVPGTGALLVPHDRRPDAEPEAEVPVAAAEPEPEPEAEAPVAAAEPEEEEHEFSSVLFTPLTEDEIRAPLPVAGGDVAEPEPDAVADGATVEGVRCIRAHFNHPEARYCAHCGIGMVQQTHRLVRDLRPPLGILVFDDGTTLSLDASYVIGRDPSRDDAVAAGEARGFVLEDPDQVLSRVHAEVRLTGWEVQLVDRHSANGTYVAGSAGEWERIEPNVPFTLTPGAKARVGRQEFVFDSHHRRD